MFYITPIFTQHFIQEISMPNTGRRAHLLTMNLNKNRKQTKKQRIQNKRFKSFYLLVELENQLMDMMLLMPE